VERWCICDSGFYGGHTQLSIDTVMTYAIWDFLLLFLVSPEEWRDNFLKQANADQFINFYTTNYIYKSSNVDLILKEELDLVLCLGSLFDELANLVTRPCTYYEQDYCQSFFAIHRHST
jgi:hypothetical protein